MTKEIIKNHLLSISRMDLDSLETFARVVSVSEVEGSSKKLLNKAIDLRFKELDRISVLLEESEIALFENEDIV